MTRNEWKTISFFESCDSKFLQGKNRCLGNKKSLVLIISAQSRHCLLQQRPTTIYCFYRIAKSQSRQMKSRNIEKVTNKSTLEVLPPEENERKVQFWSGIHFSSRIVRAVITVCVVFPTRTL